MAQNIHFFRSENSEKNSFSDFILYRSSTIYTYVYTYIDVSIHKKKRFINLYHASNDENR